MILNYDQFSIVREILPGSKNNMLLLILSPTAPRPGFSLTTVFKRISDFPALQGFLESLLDRYR